MSDSGRSDRTGSIASSRTEAGGLDEHNEKVAQLHDEEEIPGVNTPTTLFHESDPEREDDELLPPALVKEEPPKGSLRSSIIWMVVNTFATIGIVSIYIPRQKPPLSSWLI